MVGTSTFASFLALNVLGAANAGYLVWQHYHRKPLVCPVNHNCSVVTQSKWSHVFGVRNEVLGVLFFLGMLGGAVVSIVLPVYQPLLFLLFVIGSGVGVLFSLFLIGVQVFAIKDYCFYCIISAIITFLVFVSSVVLWK